MRSHPRRRSTIALGLTCAASGIAHATVTAIVTPSPITWTNVADTLAIAKGSCQTGAPNISQFMGFDPPVVPQYDRNCAFKAKLSTLGTGPTDQGVWSTGPRWLTSSGALQPTAILREGDSIPLSSNLFGNGTNLTVANLQMGTAGMTACATNTNIPSGKVAVLDNCCLQSLGESPFFSWRDLRPPVLSSFNNFGTIGIWKRDLLGTFPSGVERDYVALPSPPCTPPTNLWVSGFAAVGSPWLGNQIPRTGSPSISANGMIALFGHDLVLPAYTRRHIRLVAAPPSTVSTAIIRERTPCPAVPSFVATTDFFGTIHDRLQANADHGTAAGGLVAWQMENMRNGAWNGPAINRTSLWCRLGLGAFNCIAVQGQSAPDLPAVNLIQSFYALHVAADFSGSNDYWVFWGAQLNTPGKKAIYRTHVVAGVAGLPDLIATDLVGGFTPVTPIVGGASLSLTTLAPYFSVNINGDLLFKATCAVLAPQQHILVVASPVNNHARQVRAQSGIAGSIADSTGAGQAAGNFFLATPDQGVFSRGQAIGTGGIAAKITFGANQGIFFGL